jgi:hypothetical protein
MTERFLNSREVSELLGFSMATIQDWAETAISRPSSRAGVGERRLCRSQPGAEAARGSVLPLPRRR